MGFFNVHTVSNAYRSDYFQYLSEQWANDTNEFTGAWNRDTAGGATITRVMTDADMPKVELSVPLSQNARLRTIFKFRATPSKYSSVDSSTMVRGLFLEFEAKFTNVSNIDNSAFFMGFCDSTTGTRSDTNIIGFGLSGDAIQTLTDSAGVETTNLPANITLTDRNLYRIAITENKVEFSLNSNVVATHTTNLPDIFPYLLFYNASESSGASTL